MALQCYDKAAGIDPSNSAIFCNRALVHLKKKSYSRVISDCEIALKLSPDYLKAYHRRGKARFCLNDYKNAIKDFEIVIKHEP
mmetsp:Transcript_30127/g.5450  ORF Transcript_30127/g.5450 Transcript_30127/m.5450 type:complete len:83 (+) Transcript_30127:363-611(+)|eukprot:CAMPEP_0168315840 /NCGR_PEP_ID=MMETSP0210-20121227/12938_1 /TAXON_ID=40633 /ORGANISM="Condylostoma magnum, Strain COL2" /LENGTH=82 /DNA_ID=CAMNT_0008291989 /DNA_START=274 /DNA_END=522 /DNA_ORIENTATION=+